MRVSHGHRAAATHLRVSGRVLRPLLVALLVIFIAPATPASAGETDTFRLEPHPLRIDGEARRTFTYSVRPGSAVTDAVRLTNKTPEPRSFRVYAAVAQEHPDTGAIAIAPHHAEPRGVASWIQVEQEEVALLPGTSEIVAFSLTRPRDVSSSGTAAIVAEEIRPRTESTGIEVALRVAILIELSGDASWLQVAEPTLDLPTALVPGDGAVSTTLTNGTLQPIEVDLRWEIESLTGRTWTLQSQTVSLAPEEKIEVSEKWATVPRWGGAFRPTVTADWEAGTVTSAGVRSFFPPLWLLALVIATVGIRGLREMRRRSGERNRRQETPPVAAAPDPDALRRRLIEAALWLHAAGQDAPRELRETVATEAQAVAAEARGTKGASDIEHAARSLAAFASGLDDGDGSAQKAAHDFDEWFRQHRDDPSVKELVGT